MSGLDGVPTPDPSLLPRAATELPQALHWKDEELLDAAGRGRAAPGQWVPVSYGPSNPARDEQWVREVVRGDRQVLGGTAERWNACAVRMVVRHGQWLPVEDAGDLAPDEQITTHRFIAYLGGRTSA